MPHSRSGTLGHARDAAGRPAASRHDAAGGNMGELMAGKIALVSGATRGIGRSIAEHLAAQGARVVVTGRTVEKGEKVVSRIREAGGTAEFLRLDVTDEDSVRSV